MSPFIVLLHLFKNPNELSKVAQWNSVFSIVLIIGHIWQQKGKQMKIFEEMKLKETEMVFNFFIFKMEIL
jgi:hypothetical protein